MSDHPLPHPNDATLNAYAQGTLDAGAARTIAAHLVDCQACGTWVAERSPGRNPDEPPIAAAEAQTEHSVANPAARDARTVKADARHRAVLRGSEGTERFEIGEGV